MVFHSMNELLAYIRRGVPTPPTPALNSALQQLSIARGIKALFHQEYDCYIIPAGFASPRVSPTSFAQTDYNKLVGTFEDEIIQAICTYINTYGPTTINDPDYYGLSALFYTAQKRYFKASSLLLKHLNYTNITHLQTLNNALMSAAGNNDLIIVQLLLQNGAHANVADAFGWTPLMSAARFNNKNMIQLLIQYDATVHWATWDVQTKNQTSLSTISYIKEQLKKTRPSSLQQKENNMSIDQMQYIQHGPQASLQTSIEDNDSESGEEEVEYELKKCSENTASVMPKPKARPSYEAFIKQIASLGFEIQQTEVEEVEIENRSDDEASESDSEISEIELENIIDLTKPSTQQQKHTTSSALPLFTPMANAALQENIKRPALSVHIDNPDESIPSYIYDTPVAKTTPTK